MCTLPANTHHTSIDVASNSRAQRTAHRGYTIAVIRHHYTTSARRTIVTHLSAHRHSALRIFRAHCIKCECSTILHSSWIFTLWTLDRLISDNEVGASSPTLGCCALLRVGPCGSRIVDPPPLLGTRVGRVGRGFRTSDLPVLCPFPSERPRTPDLGSRIEWLAPHTVGAKPDPGLWISALE